MIKKGDSQDEQLLPHTATVITGITSQNLSNTISFETQKKMSPNPRAVGPVKFAKSHEVELLWLETVKARFVNELKCFLPFYTELQIIGRVLFILRVYDYCFMTRLCMLLAVSELPLD